jgi:uncharacterized membrane protein YkvA (DUF1232 family)
MRKPVGAFGVFKQEYLMLQQLKVWARHLKREIAALYLAARDSSTPLLAKIVALAVAAYALSPIDLIPDFIPVLGYVDDIIIVPLGIMLAVRLMPKDLMQSFRETALAQTGFRKSWMAAGFILACWTVAALMFVLWLY